MMGWFTQKQPEPLGPDEFDRMRPDGDIGRYRLDEIAIKERSVRDTVLAAIGCDWNILRDAYLRDKDELVHLTLESGFDLPSGLIVQIAEQAGIDVAALKPPVAQAVEGR